MLAFSERQMKKTLNRHERFIRDNTLDIYTVSEELDYKTLAERKGKKGVYWSIKCFLADMKLEEDYFKKRRDRKRILNLCIMFKYF